MRQQSLPDEIPLDQFQGKLLSSEEVKQYFSNRNQHPVADVQATPEINQQPDEIPLDQFQGELKELSKIDLLKLGGKAAFDVGKDIHQGADQKREEVVNDLLRQISRKEREGFISDLLKAFIKEPAKGVGASADRVKDAALFTTDAMGQPNIGTDDLGMPHYSSNMPMFRNAPEMPSMEKAAGSAVDTATLGMTDSEYSNPSMEVFGSGMNTLGQLAGPGGVSKLAEKYGWAGLSKVAGFLGSVDPKVLMGAMAFGATDKALEKEPHVLKRLGLDTTAALGTEAVVAGAIGGYKNPRKVVEMVKNAPYRAAKIGLGITKGNFNKDIARAFVDAGMEAPVSAVTDSKIVAFANKIIGKVPYLAEWVSKRHQKLEGQFNERITSLGEKIGPMKDDAIALATDQAFESMRKIAGEGNVMDVRHSLGVAEKIVMQLKKAAANDPASTTVINTLGSIIKRYKGDVGSGNEDLKKFLQSDMFKNMAPVQKENTLKALNIVESEGVATVDAMIEQYQQLNALMKRKDLFTLNDGGTLKLLHKFRNALNNDFAAYGKDNPAFDKVRTEAHQLFSKVKKREEWDTFWNKYNNNTQDTKRYKSLHESLHDPKVKHELSKLLGEDMVGNLELLTKSAKGMAKSVLNDPQPSGTEIMRTIKVLIGYMAGQGEPFYGLATATGLVATTWALQSKHFVKKLVEFSERPSDNMARYLERLLRKNTGLGIVALNNELDKLQKDEN